MYVSRPQWSQASDLDQGDILRGILRPRTPLAKNLALLQSGNKLRYPAPKQALSSVSSELRTFCAVDSIDALVLSNSCDNAREELPLILAPVSPFKFLPHVKEDWEKWEAISQAATGTANPKLFYLTASENFALTRAEAQLPLLF